MWPFRKPRKANGPIGPPEPTDPRRESKLPLICPLWSGNLTLLLDAVDDGVLKLERTDPDGLTHKIGSVVVWTANYPNHYGRQYKGPVRDCGGYYLPDWPTLRRLKALIARQSDTLRDRIEADIARAIADRERATDEAERVATDTLDRIAARLPSSPPKAA